MSFVVVVSPAKKMNVVDEEPGPRGLPRFLPRTAELMEAVRSLSLEEAKALWKTSDALTRLNFERFADMDLERDVTAAVVAYEGIQYTHLAAQVMGERELAWLDAHLRILSGFYGVLRPFDGVVPYRLEMQARLAVGGANNLYEYWGATLCQALAEEASTIVNVASKEYAKAVVPYAAACGMRVVTCLFATVRDGRLRQQATEAKAARGTFCRWLAERGIDDTDGLRAFGERGYALSRERSSDGELVFVRDA